MSDILGYQQVMEQIPERRPLLMVDRLQVADDGSSAAGVKAVSMDEEFFQGHFPDSPIMPGVLQVAAMTQTAGAALSRKLGADAAGKVPILVGISRLKFRKPVLPGDLMQIEVSATDAAMVFDCKTIVAGAVTCQGKLTLDMVDPATVAGTPAAMAPGYPELEGVAYGDEPAVDIAGIMGAIPHRYPFLLIDRILHLDAEALHIVGLKNVTGNESHVAGAACPILPGNLQAEIAAQVGCTLALTAPENQGKLVYFMSIDDASFSTPVVPGDQLVIDVHVSGRGRFGRAEAKLYVGDELVSTVAMKFAAVDREDG